MKMLFLTQFVLSECVNETVLEHGTILGNQKEVGKRVRYKCNTGFDKKNSSSAAVAECLDTGKWSSVTECLKTNYTWDSWSSWSTCSLSCGSGIQSRSRGCFIRLESSNGSHCHRTEVGDEQQNCNEQSCPTPTYGQPCTNNTDCIEKEGVCIEGKCFCGILYKYDNILKNCTKECEAMSDQFTKYQDKAISGFNSGASNMIYDTVEDCKVVCSDNPLCLSFETWSENGRIGCTSGSVTYDMIATTDPGKIVNSPGTNLYSKTCI